MILFFILIGICIGSPNPYVMRTLVTPASIAAYDSFGVSVSIKGDSLAIGADVGGDSSQGVVHTFKRNGVMWEHDEEFLATDGVDGDRYGNSVVVYDEWLFVGAFLQDRSGKVYVYRHDGVTWDFHSALLPLVRVENGYFGHRVRAKNYTLAISHPSAKVEHVHEAGNVNIYNNWGLNWVLGNILTPAYPTSRALHGFSVDFNRGDQMIVGAPQEGSYGYVYMYLYHNTRWNVLIRVQGLPGAGLGHAVAMNNGHAVVSSRTGGPTGNGYVVTFKNDTATDTWIMNQDLLTGGDTSSYYGNDVAIHDDVLVVGSPLEGPTGAIYIYHWWVDSWHLHHKIFGPVSTENDWYHSMFGWSLDMEGGVLVVGSPGSMTTDGTKRAGAVFLFSDIQFNAPTAPTTTPTTANTTTPTTTHTATPTTAPTTANISIPNPSTTHPTTGIPSISSHVLPYMSIVIGSIVLI